MSDQTDELTHQERARRLGAMLGARPERLRMDIWATEERTNECGTAACVAGWAVLWDQDAIRIDAEGHMTWRAAVKDGLGLADSVQPRRSYELDGKQFLGLETGDARALFFGADDKTAQEVLDALGRGELTEPGDIWAHVYH